MDVVSEEGADTSEVKADDSVDLKAPEGEPEEDKAVDQTTALQEDENDELDLGSTVDDTASDSGEEPMRAQGEKWLWPVPNWSGGLTRGYSSGHDGQDITQYAGAPIVASRSGVVARVLTPATEDSNWGGYGYGVVINHGDGYYSHYAHMDSVTVAEGQSVARGQQVGTMGATGNAQGVHLHFAIATSVYGAGGRINNNRNVIDYDYYINSVSGSIDVCENSAGRLHVAGWAKDDNYPNAPIEVHVYVGGPAGSGAPGYHVAANGNRSDVGAHAFDTELDVTPYGAQDVYFYGIHADGVGENPLIDTKSATIQPVYGAFDVVEDVNGKLRVAGWARDKSSPNQTVKVHVYVGGPAGSGAEGHEIIANKNRSDVGACAYDETIDVGVHGSQTIYVYGIQVNGAGDNTLIGKKNVVLSEPQPTEPDLSKDGWVDLSDGGKGYARNGQLVKGWMNLDEMKYYFDEQGKMLVGWNDVVVNGKTMHYYFHPSGNLARDTWATIDGKNYYFRPSGNMATGWAQIDDKGVTKTYYFEDDGTVVAGCWKDIVNGDGITNHYYFRPSGSLATGWAQIDGKTYFFRPSGNLATGWADVPDDQYKRFFDDDGSMVTGWRDINGNRYYFRSSGAMQTGTTTIDGVEYTFSSKGVLIS